MAAARFFNIPPTPEAKGLLGEWSIDSGISAAQGAGFLGRILHNAYVPKKQGGYTEIDVLYITRKGIFVFESKNYHGLILGDGKNTYWTLCVSPNTQHSFYNPILQNQAHIQHLARHIAQDIPFFSVIAYSQQCQIKKMSNVPPDTYMVHYNDIPLVMQQVWASRPDVLTDNQIVELFTFLAQLRPHDVNIMNAHVQSVRNLTARPAPTGMHVCPHCGGKLVLRTARKGIYKDHKFWGCSNYPQCTYTHTL